MMYKTISKALNEVLESTEKLWYAVYEELDDATATNERLYLQKKLDRVMEYSDSITREIADLHQWEYTEALAQEIRELEKEAESDTKPSDEDKLLQMGWGKV